MNSPPSSAAEEPTVCPRCGRTLHDKPVVIDHALRVSLTCAEHGIACIVDPFASSPLEGSPPGNNA